MKRSIDIVSASAGSGKTTRLAGELERAVIEAGISPDRILATTFTRKAAAELVERGRQALLRAGRSDDAELFRAARIGTVNSVAGMIVSEFAFEAGVSPGLLVLDEDRANEAFRRSLSEVVTTDDLAEFARLAGRFADLPWQSIVQRIADNARTNHIGVDALTDNCRTSTLGFLDVLGPSTGIDAQLDDDLAKALELAQKAIRANLESGLDKTKKSSDALDDCDRALSRLRSQRSLSWPDWARLCSLAAGAKSDASCEEIRSIASRFPDHASFREDCELAMRLCFGLAGRALSAYRRYKSERRAIDFIDQETIALELLQRDDVRSSLANDISLVLVDEFQDVSPLQLALFLALAELAPKSIWVGDQKQAIYGFRGADPALMEAIVTEVLGTKEPETLAVGRRSRAPLVHLTNALFVAPFQAAGLPPSRVTLTPSTEDDSPALGPCVERWKLEAKNVDQAIQRLSQFVRGLVDDPNVSVRDRHDGAPRRARPGDIAILCRRGDTCLAVADRLSDLGVLADVARSGLLATPEGRAVSAGLRLWSDPRDVLAQAELVQLLAPSSGLINSLLSAELRAKAVLPAPITRLLDRRAQERLGGAIDAFDGVVACLELDDLVAGWGRDGAGIANLDALRAHAVSFVRLARHHGGASSPSAFVSHLQSLASEENDAQARVGGEDTVHIMTWHGSKGLEWPIVVLFELDSGFGRGALGVHVDDHTEAVSRLDRPLEGRSIRYWPDPFHSNTSRTPFHDRLRAHPTQAQMVERGEREEVRLLYVGWTRARDRVILASSKNLNLGTLKLFELGGGSPVVEPPAPAESSGSSVVKVVWAGTEVDVLVRACPDAIATIGPHSALSEILIKPPLQTYAPGRMRPSDVETAGKVERVVRLGRGISIESGADAICLGSAVHGFLAADRPELDADDRSELGARLLSGWGIAAFLPLEELLLIGGRLKAWLANEWPNARIRRECPIEHRLISGTIVRGTADLIVEVEDTTVVLDHKIVATHEPRALEVAAGYAGQLGVYADALRAAGAKGGVDTWIHLPLSGLVVRVVQGELDQTSREESKL